MRAKKYLRVKGSCDNNSVQFIHTWKFILKLKGRVVPFQFTFIVQLKKQIFQLRRHQNWMLSIFHRSDKTFIKTSCLAQTNLILIRSL